MTSTMEFSRQVGALPVRRGPDGNLLVLLGHHAADPALDHPEGLALARPAGLHAAAAEAREEAGVLGAARAASIGSYTYEKRRPSGPVPVRVAVYLLEVEQELETWPECERRRRAWFTLTAAAEAVRSPSSERCFSSCRRMEHRRRSLRGASAEQSGLQAVPRSLIGAFQLPGRTSTLGSPGSVACETTTVGSFAVSTGKSVRMRSRKRFSVYGLR